MIYINHLFYALIIWLSVANARVPIDTVNVPEFGTLNIGAVSVNFDEIHKNLSNFAQHAHTQINDAQSTNNIAVGLFIWINKEKNFHKKEFLLLKVHQDQTIY